MNHRKHAVKVEPYKFPKDKQGSPIAGWFIDKEAGVMFIAPNVQGMGRLKLHTISLLGEVNPSVLITGIGYDRKDAEYHEFVILDGWDSNYEKKEGVDLPVLKGT